MAQYKIGTLINAELKFDGYSPEDELQAGPQFEVEADSVDTALNIAFAIGNREGVEIPWPRYLRSISVGDVFAIVDYQNKVGDDLFYSVRPVGFSAEVGREVMQSLKRSNKRAREGVTSE